MKDLKYTRITAKLIYLLKRYTDEWVSKMLNCGCHHEFNNAHLPLLMSIDENGITNNELAEKLNITKQASSKTIKALEQAGLVKSEKDNQDARASKIYLTQQGRELSEHIKSQVLNLEEQYKKVVGAKNYETTMDTMLKLIEYHEQLKCNS